MNRDFGAPWARLPRFEAPRGLINHDFGSPDAWTGPMDHVPDGSEAQTRPMNRHFEPLRRLLRDSEALTMPFNRDLGGSRAPTGLMNRDFEACWGLLGSSEALTKTKNRDFGGSAAPTVLINPHFGAL